MKTMQYTGCVLTIIAFSLAACQSTPQRNTGSTQTTTRNAESSQSNSKPVAYVNGKPILANELTQPLYEARGGEVLEGIVLRRQLEDRLADRDLQISEAQVREEQNILLDSLSPDRDEATRLLTELRRRRGLGKQRFENMLWRNAALRTLVQPEVDVTSTAVRRMYEQVYGPQYICRIIVVETIGEASRLRQRALAGGSFAQLAQESSIDASGDVGGLLSPVSLADGQYPVVLRETLQAMEPGEISEVISLDRNFAVLLLERVEEAQRVSFDSVASQMRQRVRRQIERVLMERLARVLMGEARVNVLVPALNESWENREGISTP